ncbi:hypothetical protein LIER_19071 [Lithospermum erythrorhizon]|uniref:Uncharacterized protein n=1 Tax=Lithospermum erythrorhizon TaxID=34254 RepID=A0AAV3QLS5_LITER
MVKTRGGSLGISKRGDNNQKTQSPQPIGVNEKGEHIPLQSIPHQPNQQIEVLANKPDTMLLPSKETMVPEEKNLGFGDDAQVQHSGTHEGMRMYVPPTGDNLSKNPNPNSILTVRVVSTETLVSPIRKNKKGRNVDSQHVGVENIDGMGVNFERVDSSKKNQDDDDDVVLVSSTASRRRIRASAAALEKKRAVLGAGGDMGKSAEPMDLENLEELKGGSMPKKRKRVVISESSQGRDKDYFIVDDIEVSEKEVATCLATRKSKGKMKLNDDPNRINNRRIAKGVEDMDTEGIEFASKENGARWNFVYARNILAERYLSEASVENQTYMDILDESGMNALVGDIGPHWPSIIREFICNLSEDIVDPSSSMFHKVKLRGHVFNFNPGLINKHYRRQNDGVIGSTLKLNDIIKTLTSNVLTEWPIKGQLQASVLYLKYAVMHNVAIANWSQLPAIQIVVELKAKIQALQTTVPPTVNDPMDADNEGAPADVAKPVADPPTVNDPTSDVVEVLDETTQSHV